MRGESGIAAGAVNVTTISGAVGCLHSRQPQLLRTHDWDARDLALVVRDERAREFRPANWVFLDVETTGLGPSTGVLPFLVGVGWLEGDGMQVEQYLLRDIGEEPALLHAIASRMAPFAGIVTFNGKAFDVPLLRVRHALARQDAAHLDRPHCDLLQVARRIWSHRAPDRRLKTLERCIAGVHRRGDVPGALVPRLYQEFMRTGDPARLDPVVHHNRLDLHALVGLAVAAAGFLGAARAGTAAWPPDRAADALRAARVLEDAGDADGAIQLLKQCLAADPATPTRLEALVRLAQLSRRQGSLTQAAECAAAAVLLDPDAAELYEDLARLHERNRGDRVTALAWVDRGLARPIDAGGRSRLERRRRRLTRSRDRTIEVAGSRIPPGITAAADFFLEKRPVNC